MEKKEQNELEVLRLEVEARYKEKFPNARVTLEQLPNGRWRATAYTGGGKEWPSDN